MKLTFEGLTDVGRRRKNNEDSYGVYEEHLLFVVADGMGGHAAGEVASKTAVESVNEFVTLTSKETDITWPWGLDPNLSLHGNRLVTAIRFANQKVLDMSQTRAEYEGMATTVVGVLVEGDKLHIAHVGDSRGYVVTPGGIRQLTTDHSWVLEQVAAGVLTLDQARTHPLRNVVTRALGAKSDLDVDIQTYEIQPGDTILLCSDGLSGMVIDSELDRIVKANKDVPQAAKALIDEANARGGEDNITVLLIRRDE